MRSAHNGSIKGSSPFGLKCSKKIFLPPSENILPWY